MASKQEEEGIGEREKENISTSPEGSNCACGCKKRKRRNVAEAIRQRLSLPGRSIVGNDAAAATAASRKGRESCRQLAWLDRLFGAARGEGCMKPGEKNSSCNMSAPAMVFSPNNLVMGIKCHRMQTFVNTCAIFNPQYRNSIRGFQEKILICRQKPAHREKIKGAGNGR
jgi:hypothetical protein